MRMARLSYEQSRCHCRSSRPLSFLRRMSGLRSPFRRCERHSCNRLRTCGIVVFHNRPSRNFLHATFVPWRGIFRRGGAHLTKPGAVAKWCVGVPARMQNRPSRALPDCRARLSPHQLGGGSLDLSIRQMFK